MEEDTETLDWGAHEGEENQAADSQEQQEGHATNATNADEDEDDAISLGDDDDQEYFYQGQSAHKSVYDSGIAPQAPEPSALPPSREDDTGANSQQTLVSQESLVRDERSSLGRAGGTHRASSPRTRTSSSSTSRNLQHSPPQRGSTTASAHSHSNSINMNQNQTAHNGTRLTHALPPKPVTVPSSYLPHSLSVVEAVGMASSPPSQGHGRPPGRDRDRERDRERDIDRDRSRDVAKKSNGPPAKRGSSPDLPPNWEKRNSRSNGDVYYYNRETYESTRTFPSRAFDAPAAASAEGQSQRESRQRRRHSRSPGPASSDAHLQQPSRSGRDRDRDRDHAHDRRDRDREPPEGSTRSATPDLSFKDRHYRPRASSDAAANTPIVETVRTERTEIISARLPAKARYDRDRSPEPSSRRPPSQRPRSLSPLPMQDSRNSQAQVSASAPTRERGRDRDYDYNRSSAAGPPHERDTGRAPAGRDRDRDRERNYTNTDSSVSRDLEADRHWVAPSADFSKGSEHHGARRQEDPALLDQRSSDSRDNRNASANARPPFRHMESSRGPRDREPPRQADRRERVGDREREQQQYMPTQRYRSPPPPSARARDRDEGRDYQDSELLPPPPPAGPANRRDRDRERDRPSRFEQSSSSSSVARQGQSQVQVQGQVPPSPRLPTRESISDAYGAKERAREREREPQGPPPPASYDPVRRGRDIDRRPDERDRDRERDFVDRPPSHRDRRDPALDDVNMKDVPRRPETYPPPPSDMNRNVAPPNERPPPKRYNDERDRDRDRYDQQQQGPPPSDEPPHRRRAPLPPQNRSFMTSSSSGPIQRDPPPHTALPFSEWKEPVRDHPPHRPPPDDRPPAPRRGRGEWQPPSAAQAPPRIDTRMDVDYPDAPRSAGQPSPYARPRDVSGRPPPTPSRDRETYEGGGGPRSVRPSLPSRPSAGGAGGPLPPAGPARRGPEGPPARYDDRRGGPDAYIPPVQDGRRGDGRRDGRGPGPYPERNQGSRHDFRSREENARPPPRGPPAPVTGTNNVPIGPRRTPGGTPTPGALAPSMPPSGPPGALPTGADLPPPLAFPPGMPPGPPPIGMPFNPAARPPPSTLIDPSKARDLPPGKESYERPSYLQTQAAPPGGLLPRGPKSASETFAGRDLPPHVPDNTQQLLQAPPSADRPGRRRDGRVSRFSPIEPKVGPEQPSQALPIPDRLPPQDYAPNDLPLVQPSGQDGQADIIERPPTPPPLSREPSALSFMDQSSSRISDPGQSSDARSDTSRSVTSRLFGQQQDALQQLAGSGQESALPEMPLPQPPSQEPDPSSKSDQQVSGRSFTRWGDKTSAPQGSLETVTVLTVDAEPALSRRLSDGFGERPPRHRKHPSDKDMRVPALGDNTFTSPPQMRQQDDRPGFMDRLDAPAPPGDNQPSLLERLSAPDRGVQPQSLRDRIVPSKRSHEDVTMDERGGPSGDGPYDGDDGNENKRAKRRNGRGGRRGGGRRSLA